MRDRKRKEEQWMESVDGYIKKFTRHPFAGTPTGRVLDDAAATRGKMLRPRLLMLAGQFGPDPEGREERLCKLAAMVELIHTASLIHDDVIDDAACRRGTPSLQYRYGKDAAVYAGDYLMSRICRVIAEEEMNQSGVILAEVVEEMCAGEIGQSLCRYKENVTVSEYIRNIHGKTAALFMAACRIGATESGCGEKTVRALVRFGECLGLLFQLRDDLLDFSSDMQTMGKAVQKDFQDGIYTMPVLCALKAPGGRKALGPVMRENAGRELSETEIRQMVRTVIELGGVEKTRDEIGKYRREAEEILVSLGAGEDPRRQAAAGALGRLLEKLVAV